MIPNPYDGSGWKVIALGMVVLFYLVVIIALWVQRPNREVRKAYSTSINKPAATSLWHWNINK